MEMTEFVWQNVVTGRTALIRFQAVTKMGLDTAVQCYEKSVRVMNTFTAVALVCLFVCEVNLGLHD